MYDIILAMITSFALTFVAIPSIISVARKKKLFDEPDHRKSHNVSTPSLGGIGIFAGSLFSIIMWTPFKYFGDLQYILCSFIIVFLIGAKDDIDPISPSKKLLGQLFAAAILVFKANIRLTSLYGIFGIGTLPEYASIALSIFTIIVIINAFNLIDGINGLSGGIGLLISLTMGTWFFLIDRLDIAIVAFSLAGSLIAFLKYNVTPAQIFMGDVGSLSIGAILITIAIILRIEIVFIIMSAVFAVEALSVMLQVGYFKYSKAKTGAGKRLFLMAPIHHHFEKKGMSEPKIIVRAWLITLALVLIALATIKIR